MDSVSLLACMPGYRVGLTERNGVIPGCVACSVFNSRSFKTGVESVLGPWTIAFAFGQISHPVDSVSLHAWFIE